MHLPVLNINISIINISNYITYIKDGKYTYPILEKLDKKAEIIPKLSLLKC